MNLCKSGGASGADTLFEYCAELKGHGVIHYHFDISKKKERNHVILSNEELSVADAYLHMANKTLERKVPKLSDYSGKLLRRNYYQILDSKALYAVTYIGKDGKIEGGTAWAVQMFEDTSWFSMYVYDMYTEKWYTREWNKWVPLNRDVPQPQGIYTGIGSRKLTPAGIKAIKDLYEITT